MKLPSVWLMFGLTELLSLEPTDEAVFLNVAPNRQQFFTAESVHLSCEEDEGGSPAAGWTLRRRWLEPEEARGVSGGSPYVVSALSPADRGVYWCEGPRGQKSNQVTVVVSDRAFILDIPALPVTLGADVTLCCRNRTGSPVPVHFFKYGKHDEPIGAAGGCFTISSVHQSDEGSYWCSATRTTSASSTLSVRAPPHQSPSTPGLSFSVLCFHLVVISPYCVSTALLVSLYCCRRTEHVVVMETAEFEADRKASVDPAAAVTSEYDF